MISIEGKLVLDEEVREGRIEIDPASGLIAQVSLGALSGDADLATKALVFPGFGDLHVHAREDASGTQIYKEDFLSCSEAAINGGVTFMADMPNNPVAPADEERYLAKKELARRSLIDTLLYGAIEQNSQPLPFPVPYKMFLGPSVGSTSFASKAAVEETLSSYQGQAVSFHAEDPELLEASKGAGTHEERRPAEAEAQGIEFAVYLAKKYSLRAKICHLSTAEGLRIFKQAKKEGLDVTAEVTPHHLYFDDSMLTPENHAWLQMNPPIRKSSDREALLEALREGTIDYLATDHAPHTKEEKLRGTSGVPHLDTYGAFCSWLMKEQGFSPLDIARSASINPGKFAKPYLPAGSGQGFGKIAAGYLGSLTILDPEAPEKIQESQLKTKCAWSPFTGIEFPGKVLATVVRGKIYRA